MKQHDPIKNPANGMSAEQVFNSDLPKSVKIIFLYEISMANYSQPEGDSAWGYIRNLTDDETTTAIATISGMAYGAAGRASNNWDILLAAFAGMSFGVLLSRED